MDLTDFCLAVLTCFKMTLENINETKRVYTLGQAKFSWENIAQLNSGFGPKG